MANSRSPISPSDGGPPNTGLTRRRVLVDGVGAVAGGALVGLPAWARPAHASSVPTPSRAHALAALGRAQLRHPDSRPAAALAAGTDTMPGVEHVVVLMLENHSYDNFLGMLGRGRGDTPRGDGFMLAADGRPTATNPDPDGRPLRAFRMPTTCQLKAQPSQEWEQFPHPIRQRQQQRLRGLQQRPGAMGCWTRQGLPFTYDLAGQFPIGDRWFASALAQTDPRRRFLIAATANGMTDDIGGSIGNLVPDASLGAPANGTIFERLSAAGISWIDYAYCFPTGATMELDPNYETQAQENPQNIVLGDSLLARVVGALGASPAWAPDAADRHLRRARRRLRPRPASRGTRPRLGAAQGPAGRVDLRRFCPVRVPGAVDHGRALRQARFRQSHAL